MVLFPTHRLPTAGEAHKAKCRLFYASKEWRHFRKMYLFLDPMCADCAREGRVELAVDLHHIVSPMQRWAMRIDETNMIALCKSHHSRRTRTGE